jgi:carbon monoxide dehydrogenase subunit G
MRIEQTFQVASPPEEVFDYLTNPSNARADVEDAG